MSGLNAGTLGLLACLRLGRLGWDLVAAGAICLAGALWWLVAVPYSHAELRAHSETVQRLKQSLQADKATAPADERPLAERRAAQFYDVLGERKLAEQQFKLLFAIAKRAGLSLNQAEYKSSFNRNGQFYTYQIQLPVKGSYGAIREFCELALLSIPFASLDEMSFKREAVAKGMLEAKLRFTLYLSNRPAQAPSIASAATGKGLQE